MQHEFSNRATAQTNHQHVFRLVAKQQQRHHGPRIERVQLIESA